MFHTTIHYVADTPAKTTGQLELRAFLFEHDEALGHAAVLLADRRGARLVNSIRDGLGQPNPLTRRMHRLLLELRGMLFLDHVHGEDWDDSEFSTTLAPEDPIVTELCVLADGFDEALQGAGIVPVSEQRIA